MPSKELKDAATIAQFEKINEVLKITKGNQREAAIVLGIDRKTLYNKIRAYKDLKSKKNNEI